MGSICGSIARSDPVDFAMAVGTPLGATTRVLMRSHSFFSLFFQVVSVCSVQGTAADAICEIKGTKCHTSPCTIITKLIASSIDEICSCLELLMSALAHHVIQISELCVRRCQGRRFATCTNVRLSEMSSSQSQVIPILTNPPKLSGIRLDPQMR